MKRLFSWIAHLEEKKICGLYFISQYRMDFFTLVIILSAVLMGVEVVHPHPTLVFAQRVILYIFAVEIFLRMIIAHANSMLGRHMVSGWTIFDIVIVASGFIPSSFQKVSNILRILRVFRILRLIRSFPDIKLIVSIILKSIPRMGAIGALLLILMYMYSIIGIELFGDQQREFSSFGEAFVTLFVELTGEGWPEIRREAVEGGLGYWIPTMYHVSWIILSAILMFNLFIGVIIDSFSTLRDLELKRKKFLELEHPRPYILILGWNSNIAILIKNLMEANQSIHRNTIVVLSDQNGEEMENYIEHKVFAGMERESLYTNIVTRQGDCRSAYDLSLVINENCQSIVILSETSIIQEQSAKMAYDIEVVNIITNLSGVFFQKKLTPPPIITPFYQTLSHPFPKDPRLIPEEKITTMSPVRLASKALSQLSMSSGASEVIHTLFSYEGAELYINDVSRYPRSNCQNKVLGKQVAQIQDRFHPAVLIGWIPAMEPEIHFCCDSDLSYVLQEGDQLIFLASDDTTIRYKFRRRNMSRYWKKKDGEAATAITQPQRIFILGWGEIVKEYLRILSQSPNGISITIGVDDRSHLKSIQNFWKDMKLKLEKVEVLSEVFTAVRLLEREGQHFDAILLVTSEIFEMHTDVRDILTVLQLKSIAQERKMGTRVILEVNDEKYISTVNMLELEDVLCPDYFLMGYLALLSEDPRIQKVYRKISHCNDVNLSIVSQQEALERQDSTTALGVYLAEPEGGKRLLLAPDLKARGGLDDKDRVVILSTVKSANKV